ncbi:hypothetical protein AB0L06_28290 [Spirillospora sp. NPDC052269]
MTTKTVRRSGAAFIAARVVLVLEAVLLSVPAGLLLFWGVEAAGSSDPESSGWVQSLIVPGAALALFVLAVVACVWTLASREAAPPLALGVQVVTFMIGTALTPSPQEEPHLYSSPFVIFPALSSLAVVGSVFLFHVITAGRRR